MNIEEKKNHHTPNPTEKKIKDKIKYGLDRGNKYSK